MVREPRGTASGGCAVGVSSRFHDSLVRGPRALAGGILPLAGCVTSPWAVVSGEGRGGSYFLCLEASHGHLGRSL